MSAVLTSIEQALDQIDAFRLIHEPEVTLEAVLRLQEAVGIDEPTRVLIRERLYTEDRTAGGSAAFLGLIIGLLAAQFQTDAELG